MLSSKKKITLLSPMFSQERKIELREVKRNMLRKLASLRGERSLLRALWTKRERDTQEVRERPTEPITQVIGQLVSDSLPVNRSFEINGVNQLSRLVHEEVDHLETREITTETKDHGPITTFTFDYPYQAGKWYRYDVDVECTQLLTPLITGCVVIEIDWKKKNVTYYLPSELVKDHRLKAMYEIPLSYDKHVHRLPHVICEGMTRAKIDTLLAQVDYALSNLSYCVQDALRHEVNALINKDPLGFEVRYARNEKYLTLTLIDHYYVNADHRKHEWLFSHVRI